MARSRRDGALWGRVARRVGAVPGLAGEDAEYLQVDPATGALVVTGAGAAASATALRIADGLQPGEARVVDGKLQVEPTPNRSLTERMLAKAPLVGYTLWLDTADPAAFYLAEAPTGNSPASPTFRGIRVPRNADGDPVGAVQTADGFVWNDRATAGWV